MPLPRFVVRITPGTDTRNQFTTPPDARVVEDLIAAHEDPVVGGTAVGSYTHNSSGNWLKATFTSGEVVTSDGNWDATNDCWVAPSAWFDDYTTLYFDVPFVVNFQGTQATSAGVQAHVLSAAGGSSVAEYNGHFMEVVAGPYGEAHTCSGTIPAVPVTNGQAITFRTWQDQVSNNMTVAFRFGIRLHGAA